MSATGRRGGTDATDASSKITVEVYGEDGEWFVADGHVPLDAFLAAARAEAESLQYDLDPDEPFEREPRHRWMRPILRSDCDTDDEFSWKNDEGWHQWTDDPGEPGAEPVTILLVPT